MQDALIQAVFSEGFLCDGHLAISATHFESRDASKPSEKKEIKSAKQEGEKFNKNIQVVVIDARDDFKSASKVKDASQI